MATCVVGLAIWLSLLLAPPAGASGLDQLPYLNCYANDNGQCVNPFKTNGDIRAEVATITADGRDLYVAGFHVVDHYTRDPVTGSLTLHDCVDEANVDPADCTTHLPGTQVTMNSAAAIALSPDVQQKDLYVAATGDGNTARTILHLHRNPSTGALSFADCLAAIPGTTCVNSFGTSTNGGAAMSDLKVSADGRSVLATSTGIHGAEALNLDRDAATGALTMRQCFTFSDYQNPNCTNHVDSAPSRCSTNAIDLTGVAIPPDGANVYVTTSQCALGAVLHFTRAGDRDLTYSNCIGYSGKDPTDCASGALPGDAQGAESSIAAGPDGELYVGVGSPAGDAAGLVHLRRALNGDLSFGDCVSAGANACAPWLSGAQGGDSPVYIAGFSSDGRSIYATTSGYNSGVNNVRINGGVLHFTRDTSAGTHHGVLVAVTSCFAADNAVERYTACSHPPAGVPDQGRTGGRGAALSADGNQLYEPNGSGSSTGMMQLGVVTLAPSATTGAASSVTQSAAQLSGSVNPNHGATTYHFDYGPTAAYGASVPVPDAPAGSDDADHLESQAIAGLAPGTTYHFRIVAANAAGTTYGADQTFTTETPAPESTSTAQTASPPPGQTASPPPAQSAPPAVRPRQPAATGTRDAAFAGVVNPGGLLTTVYFRYGLDSRYRAAAAPSYTVSTPPQQVGPDSADHNVSATVSGLLPNAVYHVQLVASNAAGTAFGADETFTTLVDPPPSPPVLGQTMNVTPVSGIVLIKPPPGKALAGAAAVSKGQGFVPLTEARQIPAGSEIDARAGSLQIVSATGAGPGAAQAGTFGGALFKLTQARSRLSKGLTVLSLLEGAFRGAPSYAGCRGSARATLVGARILQTLRASEHGGRFSTRGRYSAATVRGTVWDTVDRCDGTLTVVHRGVVSVADEVRHVTVNVRAGHSYLARARR